MEGNKQLAAAVFAVMVISFYIVGFMYVINPFMKTGFVTIDDSITMYIDTLSSVEQGTVKIPAKDAGVRNVRISYETEGEKEGYAIPSDGWYVLVSYETGGSIVKSASRINSYPAGASLEKNIFSPYNVCVKKELGNIHPEVESC